MSNNLDQLIIYGIDIKTFMDGNGDGIGDFQGATTKLPYLKDLGINCIWLLPFYETEDEDNGYDVMDYYEVNRRLGTLRDFSKFVAEAHRLGIKVIIDFVFHHTSNQHPWFQASRVDKNSKFRDYYIWSKTKPKYDPAEISNHPAMPGEQTGVWKYDDVAKEYYYHRFYDCEPDLNLNCDEVRDKLFEIMEFWLSFEIDGFRLDAASMLFQRKGLPDTLLKNPEDFLVNMHNLVKKHHPDGILLAEADVDEKTMPKFVQDGNRMTYLLNFILNANLFHALATKENTLLKNKLNDQVRIPDQSAWVNFLRNLDELNLERIDKAKEAVFAAFAQEPGMKILGRGIRRRTASMLEGNVDRVKMAFSLMFSFPGASMLVYGDEIGMGENLRLAGRMSVRIPMQWSSAENGGFSEVKRERLFRMPMEEGPFSFKKYNVKDQLAKENSLLNTVKKLIKVKHESPEINSKEYEVVDFGNPQVIGLLYKSPDSWLLTLHNLSEKETKVSLNRLADKNWSNVIASSPRTRFIQDFELDPYGYVWFRTQLK